MEDEKVIDLRGKTPEEIVDAYAAITKDIQKAELIWSETGNLEDAMKLYEAYQAKEAGEEKEATK